MTAKNLSTVATNVIETYGMTATNVINAYRFGGERFIGFVDSRIRSAVSAVAGVPVALGNGLRSNLAAGQQRVNHYSVKGLHLGTDNAQRAVGVAVDLATKGVSVMAAGAVRMERAAKLNPLAALNRVAMPAAELVSQVAVKLEDGSSELVKRVAGSGLPAKALATRKLDASTRKAAAARKQATRSARAQVKQVTRAATDQINEVKATRQRIARKAATQVEQALASGQDVQRSATQRVSKAVAETATQTSNVARRVARKAEAAAAEA